MTRQPVAKIPAAFDRRRIPPDGGVRRLHMADMRPPHALFRPDAALRSTGRLGATRGLATGRKTGAVLVLAAVLAAAGCGRNSGVYAPRAGGWPGAAPDGTFPVDPAPVTETALALRGVRYTTGGATPKGFDCSGFTYYVFGRHGVRLPRVATDQYHMGRPVRRDRVRPGDLVFFSTVAPGPSHVGLALGGGAFVHAPGRRGKVRVERLDTRYWARRYLGARRIVSAARNRDGQ